MGASREEFSRRSLRSCDPVTSIGNSVSVRANLVSSLTRPDNSLHVSRRALLRYSDFRRLLAAQFVAQAGDAAGTVVLAGLVFFLASDGPVTSQLVTMVATSALPILLAGPLSGFVADRYTRRGILFHGQVIRGAVSIGLLIGVLFGASTITFLLWAASLCIAKILYTARIASIRHLVRNHELVAADSASLTIGTIAGVIGGACGLALVWSMGELGFLFVAAGHVMSGVIIRRISGNTGGGSGHSIARWRDVFAHLRLPKLRYAMVATGTHRLLLGVVLSCTVLLGETAKGNSATTFAALMGASGLGTFAGTNTAEWVNEHFSRRMTTLLAFLGTASTFMMMSIIGVTWIALIGFGVSTFLFQNLRLCSDATIQSNALPGAGGREFALYDVNHNIMFLMGILIGLLTFAPESGRLIIGVSATLSALSAVASLFMSRGEGSRPAHAISKAAEAPLVQSAA